MSLVDVALGTNSRQDLNLKVDPDSIDMDAITPPTMKLSDVERHASLLFSFVLEKSLYFGINIISVQNLVGNLNKMTAANLGRQHQRVFKSSQEYLYLFGGVNYYFIPSILLKHVIYTKLKLLLLMFSYSLNNTTTSHHLSYY